MLRDVGFLKQYCDAWPKLDATRNTQHGARRQPATRTHTVFKYAGSSLLIGKSGGCGT